MLRRLRHLVETTPWLLELKFAVLKPLHYLQFHWKRDANERLTATHGAQSIVASPEYELIPKHPQAGSCKGGYLVMHNGVRVLPTCYIGWQNYAMLRKSKGVHEPEEERVFMNVLKTMRPEAVMVEFGAYWAFYSLWFQQAVVNGRSVLVEPILSHLNYGRKNFQINGRTGDFVHAFVGAEPCEEDGFRTVSLDSIATEFELTQIDILHADIQGFERDMISGGQRLFQAGKVKWAFISTHSEQLHADCRHALEGLEYVTVAEARPSEITGPDGVLVMRHKTVPDPEIHPIRLATGAAAGQAELNAPK